MSVLSRCLIITCLVLFGVNSLHAELPPGAYTQLKKQAEEVILLRIKEITKDKDYGPGMPGFICRAEVVVAERSTVGYKPGDEILFQTYYVSDAARRNGLVGPQSLPRVKAGWEGRVYLNPDRRDRKELELAAYGKSFERLSLKPRPQPNKPTATRNSDLKRLVVQAESAPLKAGEDTVAFAVRGTPLTAHKVQGSWLMVKHQGRWVWIHKKHVIQIRATHSTP